MNQIQNNPITTEDVELADRIFGPSIGYFKGKSSHQKPEPVVKDYVDIPRKLYVTHKAVKLCLDSLFVNKIPFLATVSRNIMYRTVDWLPGAAMSFHTSAIASVLYLYRDAGFVVTTIHCNPDSNL
jgi:hypothetical protein